MTKIKLNGKKIAAAVIMLLIYVAVLIYCNNIDKTELLTYTNRAIDTDRALICNSRPRRFGKSVTANMLTAYYSKGCDSSRMFEGLAISKDAGYQKYLNHYPHCFFSCRHD